jgi:hypothetical protein
MNLVNNGKQNASVRDFSEFFSIKMTPFGMQIMMNLRVISVTYQYLYVHFFILSYYVFKFWEYVLLRLLLFVT